MLRYLHKAFARDNESKGGSKSRSTEGRGREWVRLLETQFTTRIRNRIRAQRETPNSNPCEQAIVRELNKAWPRPKRKAPRRSRRGLGLLDVILGMAVLMIIIQSAFLFLQDRVWARTEATEVAHLGQVHRYLTSYVERNAVPLIKNIAIGEARAITHADLAADDIDVNLSAYTGIDGRTIDMWVVRESDEVLVFTTRASGPTPRTHIPDPAPAYGVLGSYCCGNFESIRGIGLDWNIGNPATGGSIAAQIGVQEGDTFVVTYLDIDADIRPYLHRKSTIMPDGTELHTMQTHLNLNGHNIENAGWVSINGHLIISGDITAESASLDGKIVAKEVDVTGDITTTGDITAHNASVSGKVTAGSADIAGAVTAGALEVSGDARFTNLTIDDSLTIEGNLTSLSTASATIGDLAVSADLNSDSAILDSIIANTMSAGTLTADTASAGALVTQGCSGC